jgi:hypothetical protein
MGWRMAVQENRALRFPITVWAFVAGATNMPAADFHCAVKTPCDTLGHDSVTRSRSPEGSSTVFRAPPPLADGYMTLLAVLSWQSHNPSGE